MALVMVRTSLTLQLLPLILLLFVATSEAATFNITNRCSYTVWPAALPVGGGMQLDPGMSWTLDVPAGTTGGRVWARTGCSFNGKGNGSCQTGDCGGVLACTSSGQPPTTAAEFSFNVLNKPDYFDISLVDGFNVPMDFLPVLAQGQGGPGCSKGPRCAADITSECPSELKAPGGCNNACTAFKQDEDCCTGTAANNCGPTNYSMFFARMCPDAYSSPQDDSSKTFTCPLGTNYQVVFCPPIDLTPPPPSPIPAPIGQPTSVRSSARSRVIVILAPVAGFILLIMLFIIIFFVCKRRTRRHQDMEEEFGELQGTPMRFTFQQIEVATEQLNKLGEGGFGSVFEGRFGDETIAVERLDRTGHGKK